jgi:Rieske 2Fe-2S family protein
MSQFIKASEVGTGGATALPGRLYTAPEVFREEEEKIFLSRWICAGREERIPRPGDFFVRTMCSESAIVARGEDGVVRAFHNVCRHRGTRLCDAPGGTLTRIRCPYHAWTYSLEGRLLAAPSMDSDAVPTTDDLSLKPIAVARWEGFIYLSFAERPTPFAEAFALLIGRLARFNIEHLRAAQRIDYDVRANWKVLFENFSECYHCPSVHPALVKLSPADSGRNDLTSGPFLGGYMEINEGIGSMSMSGRACAMPVGDLPEEDLHRVYYYTIFPNLLLSLHPDYVMAHTLWPKSPDRTFIECEWLFHPDAKSREGYDPDDAVRFWDRTNREDWRICELTQQGVASRAYAPGPMSQRESITVAFDREVLRSLGLDGKE